MTDALEQQGMEALVQRHLSTAGTDVDLRTQLVLYEVGWATRARLAEMGGGRQFPRAPPHLRGPQLHTSGPISTRTPCGWRMETSRKLLLVGGGSAESHLQRKAKGAADL